MRLRFVTTQRWRGIGLTLEEGGHLMDDRFMADAQRAVANGGIAERFRLIYGDVTGKKENAPPFLR